MVRLFRLLALAPTPLRGAPPAPEEEDALAVVVVVVWSSAGTDTVSVRPPSDVMTITWDVDLLSTSMGGRRSVDDDDDDASAASGGAK